MKIKKMNNEANYYNWKLFCIAGSLIVIILIVVLIKRRKRKLSIIEPSVKEQKIIEQNRKIDPKLIQEKQQRKNKIDQKENLSYIQLDTIKQFKEQQIEEFSPPQQSYQQQKQIVKLKESNKPDTILQTQIQAILREQIQLARLRNDSLQEQIEILKKQLEQCKLQLKRQQNKNSEIVQSSQVTEPIIIKKISQHSDYSNIKNQLQFCRMRLQQSQQSEKQLRVRLDGYERTSVHLITHPEYRRLRNLNNRYKDCIMSLQKHLLQKGSGSIPSDLQLSFNDL